MFNDVTKFILSPTRHIQLQIINLEQIKMIHVSVVILPISPIPATLSYPNKFSQSLRLNPQAGFFRKFSKGRLDYRFTLVDTATRGYPARWQAHLWIKVSFEQKNLRIRFT